LRRLLGACLLIAIAIAPLSACSKAVKTTGAAGLTDSIAALAGGGVTVTDDVNSLTPIVALTGTPSAMRFTRWQVQNLVAEANAHSGYLGSELDSIATPPAGSPPLSILIGAWLTRHEGALANYATGFMGAQDYKNSATIVFPTIVVLTFIADIARVTTTSQLQRPSLNIERFLAAPAEADGICTDISNWVSSVVNSVTSAVQANGSGWLASLWNTVVNIAVTGISIVVNGILQSLVGFITQIATVCGTLMQVASMFKPWSVQLAGDPATLTLGATAEQGKFDATLSADDIQWPASLVGCVQALSNVKLDNASYTDAPVRWTQPRNIPGLAMKMSEDDTLLPDKTAHYTFSTNTVEDVPQADCPVLVNAGSVGITVTVARSDISKTLSSLETLITNQINASIRAYLAPYINPALDAANTTAGQFKAPHESSVVVLKEYVADPLCSHTPLPGTPAPSTPGPGGNAELPDLPCEAMFTLADTGPSMNGAGQITLSQGNLSLSKLMSALSGVAGPEPRNSYDTSKASYCTIGYPGRTAEDIKLAAMVFTQPRALPYSRIPDLHVLDARDPEPCRTAIGYALLEQFSADCHGNDIGMVLDGPLVELGITPLPGGTEVSGPPLAPGTNAAVFKHILERYAH
jgi:hypothetical protein